MNSRFILLAAMLALAAAANNNVAVALLGIDGGYPNKLYNFLASNPALVRSTQTVSGLAQGETLLAIAKYPTAETFFAVSNLNKIYQLNATTAVASFTADLSCNVQHTNPTLSISFDPSTLQLHIMSLVAESSSNHFVADAFTGACQQMPVLSYGSSNLAFPSPAGIAYFNGKAYVVDANANSALSTINGDSLAQVGSLMHDFSGVGGFAIATADGQRYFGLAALYTPYQSSLWAINLATGQSFEAATLGKLITNLVGFAVMADGRTIDFPFPYLGDEYNPNIDYTYTPPTNFNQDDLFGTQTNAGNNGNTSPAGNSNTGANSGNTNVSPSTGNNGNNGNTPATSADAATGNGNNGNTATNGDNDNAATSGNSANTATDANNANTATNVSPSNGNGDNGNNNLNTVNRQQGSATTFGVSLVLVAAVALLAF